MKVRLFILLHILFVFQNSFAQELPELLQLTPVSPNSASFARYGSFNVNPNLGRPNISVPCHVIKSGDLQLPIMISYNSSGIRLNNRASWVGLEWNLQAGGVIVRNVKGAPDNYSTVARENISNLPFNEDNYEYLYDVWRGNGDGQPDKYILNAFGINATFYYVERNGEVELVFENNNSIKVTGNGPPNYGFRVVTEKGITLIFDEIETSVIPSSYLIAHSREVPTSYYLSEIISADKKDSISFEYKTHDSFEVPVETSQGVNFNRTQSYRQPLTNDNFWNNRVKIDKRYLDKIIFKNGYVQFESFLDRADLVDEFRLDNLKVFSSINNTDQLVKEIYFDHSYYGTSVNQTLTNDIAAIDRRLKLEAVLIGDANSNDFQKYEFEYDTQSLPRRGSSKQDFWGYINNNMSASLIPPTTFQMRGADHLQNGSFLPWSVTHSEGDANRDAHPVKMKSGVLAKIKYPTGGYTEFEFEANQREISVTTPIYENRSASILATGSGDCPWTCGSNGYQSKTFTIEEGFGAPIDARLRVMITDAFSGSGSSNSYGKFSGLPTRLYKRSAPTANIYPATEYDIPISLRTGTTYTIEAQEYGHGSNPPSYVPSVSVRVSYKLLSGSVTNIETEYLGGLRISSIKSYDGVNTQPISSKNYTYANINVINKQKDGGYVNKQPRGRTDLIATVSSSPYFDNGIGNVPAIEYGEITEYYSDTKGLDNGKKIYTYENINIERDIEDTREIYKHPLFDYSIFPGTTVGVLIEEVMSNEYDIADHIIKPFNHGSLKKVENCKREGLVNGEPSYIKVSEEEYDYNIVDESNFKLNFVYPLQYLPREDWNTFMSPYIEEGDRNSLQFYFKTRKIYSGKKLLTSTIKRYYDEAGLNPVETLISYKYNEDYFLTETSTTLSDSKSIITKTIYPDDIKTASALQDNSLIKGGPLNDFNAIDRLKGDDLHQIAIPIQVETYKDENGDNVADVTELLSLQRTNFYEPFTDLVLPKDIESLKGVYNATTNSLKERMVYHLYDSEGNPIEVSKADGAHVYYIWGYNKEYPIAKIENTSSNEVENAIASLTSQYNTLEKIQALSNADTNRSIDQRTVDVNNPDGVVTKNNDDPEGNLREALRTLRAALPDSMITTYTYDPLVGVTSITDPKGYTMYYEYDELNRLKQVIDADGHIVSQNEYHYKTPPEQN
ncbi:RHS repeat domain-containing protein [uncultured Algibacter sp.]|uniref:RHS repeat domain-containing protein n=1 Tax=uncultured Algibacter sp. TaxID=298659 RepID=UPI0026120A03|nr:RHS repeat domain-containing protein [uncultured Algibacter sp.]